MDNQLNWGVGGSIGLVWCNCRCLEVILPLSPECTVIYLERLAADSCFQQICIFKFWRKRYFPDMKEKSEAPPLDKSHWQNEDSINVLWDRRKVKFQITKKNSVNGSREKCFYTFNAQLDHVCLQHCWLSSWKSPGRAGERGSGNRRSRREEGCGQISAFQAHSSLEHMKAEKRRHLERHTAETRAAGDPARWRSGADKCVDVQRNRSRWDVTGLSSRW